MTERAEVPKSVTRLSDWVDEIVGRANLPPVVCHRVDNIRQGISCGAFVHLDREGENAIVLVSRSVVATRLAQVLEMGQQEQQESEDQIIETLVVGVVDTDSGVARGTVCLEGIRKPGLRTVAEMVIGRENWSATVVSSGGEYGELGPFVSRLLTLTTPNTYLRWKIGGNYILEGEEGKRTPWVEFSDGVSFVLGSATDVIGGLSSRGRGSNPISD